MDLDRFIEDVLDSVALAMKSEGIAEETVTSVVLTVSDYIANHYD